MSTNYFKISGCTSGSSEYNISINGFLPEYASLIFEPGSTVPDGCYQILFDIPPTTPDGVVNSFRTFDDCETCLADTPPLTVSAGTEYYICVVCPDGTSGYTYTPVAPPHPVATNAQGFRDIIQMGAVVIGGPNGLNN